MTNVEALKLVYVALGGNASDFNATTNPEAIALIATVCSGGSGSGLPAVTADDNGSVLTVVEGAWAKAAAPTELPAVTAEDDGDVLTVVDGAWAAATPTP